MQAIFSSESSQLDGQKKNESRCISAVRASTSKQFAVLQTINDDEEVDDNNSGIQMTPKPPPVYIPDVGDESIVFFANDIQVRLLVKTADLSRKVVNSSSSGLLQDRYRAKVHTTLRTLLILPTQERT